MNRKPVDAEKHPSSRKQYQQPTLRAYGSIQEITRTGASGGSMTDNRGAGMIDTRTH